MTRLASFTCSLLLLSTLEESPPPAHAIPKLPEVIKGIGERGGLVLAQDAFGDSAQRLVYLDQGWGPPETLWFYHADQGSGLLPYKTLIHLEQADSEQLLIQPENLARFRFLNQHKTPNNPDALPIGFARHEDKVGLTCAACHTAQINYKGTAMRIDGAPALANVTAFQRAIKAALSATLSDEGKLSRYAKAAHGGSDDTSRAAARKSLTETLAWFDSYITANQSSTEEGFARLDAIGRIVNQVIRFTSSPKNSAEPNAPTSFPLLWDAPRHDYVQWTGFSPNAGAGSLGRNVGEVIGVFGHIEVKHYDSQQAAKKGYASSIEAGALVAMEESLRKLKSPKWPEEILPVIDRKLASQGEALYKTQCLACHALIDRADPRRKVTAIMTGIKQVGTDDTSARNLAQAKIPTGILAGAVSPRGDKYGDTATALAVIADLVTRALAAKPIAAVQAVANAKLHGIEKTTKQGEYEPNTAQNPSAELMAYKARPLNGIWASSPYLHNGSVPTLYDLLLPPAERPKKFSVGRLEFDPKKVGYVSDGEVPFVLDTSITGNSNRGHEYGIKLSPSERWALVEYLKTL